MMLKNNHNKTAIAIFLWFFLVVFICIKINSEKLYANIGTFYFKRGSYITAQEFFEKSYRLGNNDTKFRKNYLETLINSPLTINAQEQLVKIAQDEIQDSVSESAKYYLRNLKKEIHNKYPDNYIKQAPNNNEIIHWGKLPVTYTFKNTNKVPKDIINAVNEAFDAWERASAARIKFQRVNLDNANIEIRFTGKRYENPEYDRKYVIAYTVPVVAQSKLEKMEIEFNIYDLYGELYTPNQIYNTALHEIFHALGFMGHSQEEGNIMYMSKDTKAVLSDTKKELTESDKVTLDLFYKIKPDVTNANELEYKYIPYLVLGDNEEINDIKADEARRYIRNAPTVSAGYVDLAQTLLNEKKYTLAISCLERALRLAHDDKTRRLLYYNLGVSNYYDGNYELAVIYIEKAEEIADGNELHELKAEIYSKENKIAEAEKEYTFLIENSPKNIDYSINFANMYLKNKNYLKASKTLKKYIKNNPDDKNNPLLKPYKILLIF